MGRLQDKVAIITGSANGIGFEAAQLFAKEGAKVVLADFDQKTGQNREKDLKNQGFDVRFIQVNVADRSSVDQMVEQTRNIYGGIDILVNNAGITRDAMLSKMTPEQFKQVIDVNLTGVFHCTQAVLSYLVEKGKGKVINTSSVSGAYGNVGQSNYAAAKAGLIGLTKTWAKELARKNINVNAVAPGFTETAMVESVPDHVVDAMKKQVPMGRLGKPRDIAHAYLYLASDESDYVNGHVLHVDGGIMM
ncbi:3-oxoacyl-ACP reductase FabG [Tenuibacillus multivorans]|uniref:3-oxoacyl-[acyl-carrier protein] reductase n=1 Tax=Tenuibacillus multivorans TaxID=237069 RepID=A0A1H0G1V9_9BACI|nr:3-oxoacyl-ACP reductase FabG [Tenuibacillus multivorans]GEL78115.1 3-oxoacyl-[acyl-carrier-protein] reductase FabG [Tenuibacillus multivorans]SDO00875.1 3-oxoacyl-[acyl-carrier protein] reductase [Tenuibacillus multivorans]